MNSGSLSYTCLFIPTGEHRVIVDTGRARVGCHELIAIYGTRRQLRLCSGVRYHVGCRPLDRRGSGRLFGVSGALGFKEESQAKVLLGAPEDRHKKSPG